MKLTFAGDFSLGDRYLQRWEASRPSSPQYQRLIEDPLSFVRHLRPFFARDRIAILNLETVLTHAASSPLDGRKDYIGQDAPARTMAVLQELGIDAVSLANNHSKDFGEAGLLETMHHLACGGIRFFGAGSKAGAGAPFCIGDTGNRPVYVVGSMRYRARYAEDYDYFAQRTRVGVDAFNTASMTQRVLSLRRREPHAWIVLFPHWGRNYRMRDEAMRAAAEAWVQAGANLILGHGAHALQECECIQGVPVCYSLGNAVFNAPGRYARYGMHPFSAIAHVELGEEACSLRLYPIVTDNRLTNFQVCPVDAPQAEDCASVVMGEGFALQSDRIGWHFALHSSS
ncbi:MAG: CapA family protein [Algiphilus sp.]